MKPSAAILEKALKAVKSAFTKEIIEFGFTPKNENHFGVSVVNHRGGKEIVIDYTFTVKTGKEVKSEIVEERFL